MLAAVTVLAIACGGSDSKTRKSTNTATAATAEPTTRASAAPFTTPPANQVGQQFTNLGITLTVTSAEVAEAIPVNVTNSRPGSGFERHEGMPAGPGAKYVVIRTHVINNAKKSEPPRA